MANPLPIPLPEEGSCLGQYEIIRRAGAGGMGVVYLARDVDLHREVGLKVLRPSPSDSGDTGDPNAVDRLLREARSAARLNHPNAVAIYQVGRHEGLTFIAMEWVDGGSLSEHLRHGIFLEWHEATAAIRDAAAGLAAAHRAGIIHRDLKPANLMRTSTGLVKVVDFGLARVQDLPSDLTATGTILGTPAYLAPEQCRGEPATVASDIYALTCTYFHLVTSRPPFEGAGVLELLQKHLHEPFPDARRFADEIPDAVIAILERGSRKNPAERYPDCTAMLLDLEAALAGRPVSGLTAALTGRTRAVSSGSAMTGDLTISASAVSGIAATPAPNNLPHATNQFVGRHREMADARRLLGAHRLVTLLGPGGTGKTRLSLELARGMLNEFGDGVWFADLAGLTSGDAVPQAVASAVGVIPGGGQSPTAALLDNLLKRHVLIVLDNCEHVIPASAELAQQLLALCPGLRLLATSRQPLGCAGEMELRVPPLSAPESEELPPMDQLAGMDAVKLFVDRAAHARAGFVLTADNAAAVANICRRLDGVPLAIELAAARVKVLSANQIAERLDDAFKLLTTGPRTMLPRQRTLRALIDWSYDLLSEEERIVFARLSVFAGSFSLESAEHVAGAEPIEGLMVLDLLADLADKSLLAVEERDGNARYRMLVTIRQYACEKMDESGERAAVERRYVEHFLAFAEEARPYFNGPDQGKWLRRVDLEHDNLRAALDWRGDGMLALQLAATMVRYWFLRGYVIDGVARLERMIAQQPPDAPASKPLAQVLDGAGLLMIYQGDRTKAQAYLERALAMGRELGDRTIEVFALNNLGTVAKETGNLLRAQDLFEQVQVIYREQGNTLGLANSLNNLGITLLTQVTHLDRARDLLKESMALHRSLGNTTWEAYGHLNLAEVEHVSGNNDLSREHYAISLRLLEALGDEWGVAYAIDGLGKCDLSAGDISSAEERFERALRMLRKQGDKSAIASVTDNLAQAAIQRGDRKAAWPLARQSVAQRLELDDKRGLAASLETLAELLRDTKPQKAAMLLGGADALRKHIQSPVVPAHQTAYQAMLELVRQSLGEDEFSKAFESGRLLDPGAALVLVE